MFLFVIGLIYDIMLQDVDVAVKQASKLGTISVELDNSFQKCELLFESQDRMSIIAASNRCEGKHWKKMTLV